MRKGKRDVSHVPFVRLSKELLFKRGEWWALHPGSRDLYFLVKGKYNGSNNGSIRLSYSEIRKKNIQGLKTNKQISMRFKELCDKGWIERKRIGGLYHAVNEYELTSKFDFLI